MEPFRDRYPTTRRVQCDKHAKPYEYTQTQWRGNWTPATCPECDYMASKAATTAAIQRQREQGK